MTVSPPAPASYRPGQAPDDPMLEPPRERGWLLTSAAIGGVTALGAEAAAAVPARRAVFGGDDSSPDRARALAAAEVVLAGATIPFVLTWQSVVAVRHRAGRAWRGLPDGVPELTD